jgi:hypothetical protein
MLKGPVVSWIDYQRNFVEIKEKLEQRIIEDEEKQFYWNNRPSVGFIFKETLKEITRKAWIEIEFNIILDHRELLPKILPPLSPNISPISILITYTASPHKPRSKWKSAEQRTLNSKFRWKRKSDTYVLNQSK